MSEGRHLAHAAARQPCSDASRTRDDPIAGSGGFGAKWLLVEIDGSWGRSAFLDSSLDREVGRAIAVRAERAGLRPVAIRRFGRRADERRASSPVRWAIADARPGHEALVWGAVSTHRDLLEVPLDGSTGLADDRAVVLVCTHARHDRCCAVRGRPVAKALAERFPAQTWECSHLGGDRFAATMLVLPTGLYYGRVPADEAPGILQAHEAGRVVPQWLRGRSSLTMPAQAAVAAARARFGDDGIDAFPVLGERFDPADARWHVQLDHRGSGVEVLLRETLSEPLLSTCAALEPQPVRQFETVDIRVTPS